MEYFAKSLSLFFLLVLVLFSPLQIQARESKFFNKFTHFSTNNKVPESEISAPTPTPAPAPAPAEFEVSVPAPAPALAPTLFYAERESGYGLYGKVGSNQFPPTKGTETSITEETDLLNEQLSAAENYETGNQNSNYNNNLYTSNYKSNGYGNTGYTTVNYNNNGYSNSYNPNGYETEKQGLSDTRLMQNYNNNNNRYTNNNNNVYTSNYNNNGHTGNTGYNNNGYSSNYNTNGYENEKQGMSDTRFLENGKYYYNVKNENNYPATYESERQIGVVKNEGSYGNTQSTYEFNTMEEYENQPGGYQVNPENYVP
ncbi:protein E6 [Pistacia vera]|uniref:protein E6 n=1 Tax=Pistacia vera TaxID=55513 RepID=UPI0012634EF3|nr:protein E6 [Pistacia vera]